MKNIHRLLIVTGLIIAETLLAQTTPAATPQGARHRGGPGGPAHLPPILLALDTDHDGKLSTAEISTAGVTLQGLDINGDGFVSLDELRPSRPADAPTPSADAPRRHGPRGTGDRQHPLFPVMFALDANGDGELQAAEIANASASLLALDANHDGKLTRDELRPLPPGK